MSCAVGRRCGSDLAWLWRRLAATAPIGPLAWEPPSAMGVALKRQKKKVFELYSFIFTSVLSHEISSYRTTENSQSFSNLASSAYCFLQTWIFNVIPWVLQYPPSLLYATPRSTTLVINCICSKLGTVDFAPQDVVF